MQIFDDYLKTPLDLNNIHYLCLALYSSKYSIIHNNIIFCSTLSEFENFLLCERILINVNLSKRNVKLILKVLSDLEPLRG
jgi:hypothetical protein